MKIIINKGNNSTIAGDGINEYGELNKPNYSYYFKKIKQEWDFSFNNDFNYFDAICVQNRVLQIKDSGIKYWTFRHQKNESILKMSLQNKISLNSFKRNRGKVILKTKDVKTDISILNRFFSVPETFREEEILIDFTVKYFNFKCASIESFKEKSFAAVDKQKFERICLKVVVPIEELEISLTFPVKSIKNPRFILYGKDKSNPLDLTKKTILDYDEQLFKASIKMSNIHPVCDVQFEYEL